MGAANYARRDLMTVNLKKLNEQVIVITGASSGIGLCTARMAARSGARVMMAARNEAALQQIGDELAREDCDVGYAVTDVADDEQVQRLAEAAVQRFGGFDTWVNNAGVSIYGQLEDIPLEDAHRMFDTDFWGVVYGSQIAAKHLKQSGGAIINVGSVASDRAIPLQGYYSAAKHAVKGYTDVLRMDLEKQGAPVSVTLIKPTSIDTMFAEHARNYTQKQPTLPPPVYAPEVVAQAILHAAQYPVRDVLVGGGAKMLSAGAYFAPRTMDKYLRTRMYEAQLKPNGKPSYQDSLYQPRDDLKEREGLPLRVMESSLYTKAALHPKTTWAALMGVGLAAVALWRARSGRRNGLL
jgi:NADP-dependent 3-hydroxy acid dehydrogenase YdfG